MDIHSACYQGCFHILDEFLKNNPRGIFKKNQHKQTLLHNACDSGNLKMVQYLVEKKAKVNVQDEWGGSPLHYASEHGYLDIVNYLVENGAAIHIQDKYGETPLHKSIENKHLRVAKYLESKGAKQ